MSNTAIDNLRGAVLSASASGSFALDAAFLTSGLSDPSVTVPASYDSDLAAAFQTPAATFQVTIPSPDHVGPVTNGAFTVTGATIPFPGSSGSPLQSPATIVFVVTEGSNATLVVQIASAPTNWTWIDSFAYMGGWPFNQLVPASALFIFSTVEGAYPYTNAATGAGITVEGGAKQNFSSGLPMPPAVEPYLTLFTGLTAPAVMTLEGVLDMSAYGSAGVLYPSGILGATLQDAQLSVFYLAVSNPTIALQIPPPADSSENDDADDNTGQSPFLTISAGLEVGDTPPDESPYILQVQVTPTDSGNPVEYAISLTSTGEGSPLTPASIVALVGGSGSYFTGTPAVLQQFLASVSLEGLSLSGSLNPLAISQAAVVIGSSPDTSWSPIPYPPPGLDFTITGFELEWWMTDPLETTRQQSYLFETEFTLLPSVFKSSDGTEDGVFSVSFTSELTFEASFEGTATLSDFLSTMSGGVVSLPSWIEAGLSDISLSVDSTAGSFSFSSGFDVSLSFLTFDDWPILSITNGTVSISATTPPESGSGGSNPASVWQGSVEGLLGIGSLQAYVTVAWDDAATPAIWNLSATLTQPVTLDELIKQFFNLGKQYDFPVDILPGTLTISTFAISAEIPSGGTRGEVKTAEQSAALSSYSIDVSFLWSFNLGGQEISSLASSISLLYANSGFSGTVTAEWTYSAINLDLLLIYSFESPGSQTLSLEWEGFTATYTSGDSTVTFTLQGWTLGSLIQALMRTLGKPYFTLASPWDLLNEVSLEGLSLSVSLEDGITDRVSASYTLSGPLNLGFVVIEGLTFRRQTATDSNGKQTGRVTLAIKGTSALDLGNLMNPDIGEDVTAMPPVPGRGNTYFKVFLLALGQRIGITEPKTGFDSTEAVIAALEDIPSTEGDTNPVNPAPAGQGQGQPYYNQSNNWLIAGHFGLMQVAGAWTVDAMVVFNDPNLYGLRLALAGKKAGGLAGLAIDILYKKISDDVGLFQIDFTFPDSVRYINMGAISITLPQIGIEVYTNGDFMIDVGFPWNMDFQRSFALYAIIPPGIPVMGAGGFYFGSLGNAASTLVPQTSAGTFEPVIAFGVGLQLGLGYNVTEGPLSAGFSLTIFGIVEGVLAAWHPYDGVTGNNSLQDEYYFKLNGTIGIIGLLYGKVDFGIVQASVNVKIVLSLQISYESFRAIKATASARVSVTAKVRINLGLFHITLSFSFDMTVSEQVVIGTNEKAPWDSVPATTMATAARLNPGRRAVRSRAAALRPRMKTVTRAAETTPAVLKLLASPQFTVLAPEGATKYTEQEGAFVFLTVIDAPTATGEAGSGATSFDLLCGAFFPWVIDALGEPEGDSVDLNETAAKTITRDQLDAYIERLADTSDPPLDVTGLLGFLASAFILNIETPEFANSSGDQALFEAGTSVFPVFDGLSLTVPDPSGTGTKPVTFETYALANAAYRETVSTLFEQVEAVIEDSSGESAPQLMASTDNPESMAALIFVDYFCMMGRQLLQAARNLLDAFAWPLAATDSIDSILTAVNAGGNTLELGDIATPNQDFPLSAPVTLMIPELNYPIQASDTLQKIADRYSDSASPQRWQTAPAQLITLVSNQVARILQPGVEIPIGEGYTTIGGDTFQSVADALGISVDVLSKDSVIYTLQGLLTPSAAMSIPSIAYVTAPGDTLRSVANFFGTTVPLLATSSSGVAGIFSTSAEGGLLTLANLIQWTVEGLWGGVQATDQVAQTAGMISRFLMFGLRLPSADGLTLSSEFLFPRQTDYGLYQLIGQEFPVAQPQTGDSFGVQVSVAASSHGVSLSFVEFNGQSGISAEIDLTQAYASLGTVLTWVQQGNFRPSPTFTATPLSLVQAKAFATNNLSYWAASNVAALETLMGPATGVTSASSAQVQPTLWPLPSSLLSLTEARQNALSAIFTDLTQVLPLMPQFQPQKGQTSPSSQQTDFANLQNWAWTTRVDFKIRQLPVTGMSSGGADSTPSGTAIQETLPNVYEVTGASTADARLLEMLLTAMDSMGPDIVSGLFLLYPQPGQTGVLATLDTPEFLAFLTQTNLSTETNPEMAMAARAMTAEEVTLPRGIGNSPQEFIKLLWELSTVRSGGYYLFYQVIDGGGGFPAGDFDTNGIATLSMVATFTAPAPETEPLTVTSLGWTPMAFVNSFVTTDSVDTTTDVVQLLSLAASGNSAPMSGAATETVRSVGAVYGAGPGAIAESNADLALKTIAVIPVKGLVRQLSVDDAANPDQALAILAAYYSNGASNTITAADIQAYNPGVAVETGAVFYIPTVNYVVPSSGSTNRTSPGNTFGQMAAYYRISLTAMAINALDTPSLFPADAVLTIDTEVLDLQSMLAQGNVSFELTLQNPGDPPDDPAASNYTETYMYSLYNILSAGLLQNTFFAPDSAMGLPFGPQTDNSDVAAEESVPAPTAFSSHARVARHRRAMLTSQANADFEFSQSLGFASFSNSNAAPVAGAVAQSENPYTAVGGTCQVSLRWQDVFGNTTITPFQEPPAGYTGALNGSAVAILYSDSLQGISAWPKTIANYIYSGAAGSPVLNLQFGLDTTAYENNLDQVAGDLAQYQLVYFQLNQDYTNLEVPGVSGNAVTMSLENSLLRVAETAFTRTQADAVRAYVSACVDYLSLPTSSTVTLPAPSASIDIPMDTSGIAEGNIIAMNVSLIFTRNAVLTDPAVAAIPGGLSVSGAFLPKPDAGGAQPAYLTFAGNMEAAFQTEDWYLKVGEGTKAASGAQGDGNTIQLWAVRFGRSTGNGIFFTIDETTPSYYAPKPIATTSVSGPAQITDYTTGAPANMSFNGVDQNLWFQTCLSAIDSFLSATDSTSAFILDKLRNSDSLASVLESKQRLADSIASTVLPVLSTSLADESTQWAAGEKLRQQLLNQIGAAYSAGASVVYNLTGVSGAPTSTPAGPPNLYGQPHGSIPAANLLTGTDADTTGEGNQNFTLTSARIPLGPTTVGALAYDPRLSFFFTTRNVESQAYVPLQLSLDITHLEFDRSYVAGIEGYVESQWLVFVTGPFTYDLTGNGVANIPVVDRTLPTPPTVQDQSAVKAADSLAAPLDLTLWKYSFGYLYRSASQDSVHNTIQINSPSSDLAQSTGDDGGNLFTALAQFVTAYPAISADFVLYLEKIDAETTDQALIDKAGKAVDAFRTYIGNVASAYAASLAPPSMLAAALPQLIEVTFETVLLGEQGTGAARTDVLKLKIDGIDATFDASTMTISNGEVTLPAPVVAIDPEQYTPVIPTGAIELAYNYQLNGSNPPSWLLLRDAATNPERTVSMAGLDVLLHQNCLASVSVDRNEILFPVEDLQVGVSTNPEFIFTTPAVSFAEPVVPRLVHSEFPLDQPETPDTSLETLLNTFFRELFKEGDGSVSVEISMTGDYSYQMDFGFMVSLPVCLLPPVETQVDPAVTPAFTSVVANAVSDWITQQHPTTSGQIQVGFKLTVFGSNDKQPFLVVNNLFQAIAG